MTPTQRSLELLRSDGYECEVVEWRDRFGTTHDLLGGIDILALRAGEMLGVQTTTIRNAAARAKKVRAEPKLAAWLNAGGRLVVHGWRKLERTGKWECRIEEIA